MTEIQGPAPADTQGADNAGQSTATTTPAVDETKETKTAQQIADEEIAADLLKDVDDNDQDADEKSKTKKKSPAKDDAVADDKDEADSKEQKDEKKSDEDVDFSKEEDKVNLEEERQKSGKTAEARKAALQQEIRDLVSKRNELRADVEQTNAKAYRTETAEELQDQGLSPEEAEIEAQKQEMQMREFNTHVADLNAELNLQSLQVLQDFPIFDPDSDLFDEKLSARVRSLYEASAQPKIDQRTGLVIQSNIGPYEFYKAFAETVQSNEAKTSQATAEAENKGRVEGQKAADKELAAAEVQSSTAPRQKAEDPFLKGLLGKD